jgi:hypothetical protein
LIIFFNYLVNMSRSKSAPGLLQASLAVNVSGTSATRGIKRYGTLPSSLLKRTDTLLFSTSPNAGTTLKRQRSFPFTQAKGQRATNRSSLKILSNNRTISEHENAIKETSFYINEKDSPAKSSSDNNQETNTTQFASTNQQQSLNSNTTGTIKKTLSEEIEGLKKRIYFLEAENTSLNLRLAKQSNWSYINTCDLKDVIVDEADEDADLELETAKAKQESDSDEFKV